MGDKHEAQQPEPREDGQHQDTAENSEQVEETGPENGAEDTEFTDDQAAPEDEVSKLRDALLRTRAEMDNMEKRGQRELEKARRFQLESLMRDLLPVIDGLEQGLENAESEDEQSREGLGLTHKLLLQALEKHGLEVVDPMGETFDPQWHEAMSMQPSEDADPDTVLMVVQKGYRLHDRLLRAARVIVAKAP